MRDLNDLQFFVAVVTQRSFSAAARFLDVPKSRVSRRVSLFEERLGVRLVERSTRRVNITEIGQLIFEHARASLVEADAIEVVTSVLTDAGESVTLLGEVIPAQDEHRVVYNGHLDLSW